MRFISLSVTALVAMATSALAQTADFDPIYKPQANEVIEAGSTYTITWQAPEKYARETVSIHLIGGDAQDKQVPISDIDANVDNSAMSYAWKVDSSLGKAKVYGLVIKLKSNPAIFQYSMPFQIKGNGPDPSSSTSVNSVASSAAPASGSTSSSTSIVYTTSKAHTTSTLTSLASSALPSTSTVDASAPSLVAYPLNNCSTTTLALQPSTSQRAATSTIKRESAPAATTSLARNPTSTPVTTSAATSVARAGFMSIIGSIMVAVHFL